LVGSKFDAIVVLDGYEVWTLIYTKGWKKL
jgi:hypothetical protein